MVLPCALTKEVIIFWICRGQGFDELLKSIAKKRV